MHVFKYRHTHSIADIGIPVKRGVGTTVESDRTPRSPPLRYVCSCLRTVVHRFGLPQLDMVRRVFDRCEPLQRGGNTVGVKGALCA